MFCYLSHLATVVKVSRQGKFLNEPLDVWVIFYVESCTGALGAGSSQNRNLKISVSSLSGIPRYTIVTKCYILCPVKL